MNILTTFHGLSGKMRWSAIDQDTYTAEYRDGVPFSTSPQGWGDTEEQAVADLKYWIEEEKS